MKVISSAEAPSNIALIKYMGKVKGGERNRPTNSSLSLTLSHLRSRVEISESPTDYDEWQSIEGQAPWIPTQLSDRGRKRYLAHFEFLKQKMGITGRYLVRSANNFPSDCGIASSASSFAALTLATYELAKVQNPKCDMKLAQLAELSRIGSGSSIRSFLSPFVLWNEQGISTIEMPYQDLLHKVVLVDRAKKAIGSSDAHERVTTSLLFEGRPARAEKRLNSLVAAMQSKNWSEAFQICWAEFWDMHALFATSQPAFYYMSERSQRVLDIVFQYWEEQKDGPLVTMDAGPNVHLIFRADQKDDWVKVQRRLEKEFDLV